MVADAGFEGDEGKRNKRNRKQLDGKKQESRALAIDLTNRVSTPACGFVIGGKITAISGPAMTCSLAASCPPPKGFHCP
jgi:hypothetical protein